MREALFLVGRDDTVLWREEGTSAVALPDSGARWEAIWRLRDELVEIAHSHPVGPAAFSAEDEETMKALMQALGRPVRFSVVTPDIVLVREEGRDLVRVDTPDWVRALREASGLTRSK